MPDIDVLAFKFGIPYEHMFGHRGFTHSLFFAVTISVMTAWFFKKKQPYKFTVIWLFLFLSIVSHGVLDALTNGGLGVAFFSPFSNKRYFFPIHPIEVSTLNIKYFFMEQGLSVIKSELKWVWSVSTVIFVAGLVWKRNTETLKVLLLLNAVLYCLK